MNGGDRIKDIAEKIEALKKDLYTEYLSLQKKYEYYSSRGKVVFSLEKRRELKLDKNPLLKYVFGAKIRHILSMPFIYGMLLPGFLLDFSVTIYQMFAFPLYGIPKVSRKDYFVYDRRFLAYLNIVQKANCLYCSYMNGLFAYAAEIAGRTEQYWCPIKHATHIDSEHRYFKDFADYGNSSDFNDKLANNICFKK